MTVHSYPTHTPREETRPRSLSHYALAPSIRYHAQARTSAVVPYGPRVHLQVPPLYFCHPSKPPGPGREGPSARPYMHAAPPPPDIYTVGILPVPPCQKKRTDTKRASGDRVFDRVVCPPPAVACAELHLPNSPHTTRETATFALRLHVSSVRADTHKPRPAPSRVPYRVMVLSSE